MSWTKFVFATDSHGDMQDDASVAMFFKFMAEWKPAIRVMGGDAFDLRPLRKGASEDEKRESIRADIIAGKKFLKRMQPTHFLRGNHDERLWELAENIELAYRDRQMRPIGKKHRPIDPMYKWAKGLFRKLLKWFLIIAFFPMQTGSVK